MRRPPLITAASVTVALGALAWLVRRELAKPWPDLGPLTQDGPPPGPSCLLCGDIGAGASTRTVLKILNARVCTTCAPARLARVLLTEKVLRARAQAPTRTCIGCGCTDDHACIDDLHPLGCSWTAQTVEHGSTGFPLCTRCDDLDVLGEATGVAATRG